MRSSASTIVNRLVGRTCSASSVTTTRFRGLSTLVTTTNANTNTTTASRIQNHGAGGIQLFSGLNVPIATSEILTSSTIHGFQSRSLSSAAVAVEEPPRRRKLEQKNPIVVVSRLYALLYAQKDIIVLFCSVTHMVRHVYAQSY